MTSTQFKMASFMFQSVLLFLLLSQFAFFGAHGYPVLGHTKGQPWPMPKMYKPTPQQQSLNKETFNFVVGGNDCDILQDAFRRYYKIIFYPGWEQEPAATGQQAQDDTVLRFESRASRHFKAAGEQARKVREMSILPSLNVNVMQACEQYPSLQMDESYTLSIASGAGKLISKSVWGALRGLETFSQLIYEDDSNMLLINNTDIDDAPRFPHRGAMLDTSRHFLPKIVILQNLDAMAYNKLNVFHWHIVDDESFPYQSRVLPKLSLKGAWEPYTHTYTQEDIAEIIEYARMRGIRVIPEFDTPGHSKSWGKGQPGLLTECYSSGKPNGQMGPIDPSKESTYSFLTTLYTELRSVFKDHYLHLGGDEVSFACWQSNPNITAFMKMKNITGYSALESYYENRLLDILNNLSSGYMVWQEVVDNGCKVRPDTVVHVWINFQKEMDKITKMGLRTILSTPWYLNYISYGSDWKHYYSTEPLSFNGDYSLLSRSHLNSSTSYKFGKRVRQDTLIHVWEYGWQKEMYKLTKLGFHVVRSTDFYLNYISYGQDWKGYYKRELFDFNGTAEQNALVMGGELCMWGEYVDGSNAISRIWPRGSAVAERLWSPQNVTDVDAATPRLEEHRCRTIRRGLNAEPVSGPGYCKYEYVPRH